MSTDAIAGDTSLQSALLCGVFASPEAQLAILCRLYRGFTDDQIEAAERQISELDLSCQTLLKRWTLAPYLATDHETFNTLARLVYKSWECYHLDNSTVQSDVASADNLRRHPKVGGIHQAGLRWELIDYGAYYLPEYARTIGEVWRAAADSNQTLATAGVLAQMMYSPVWVASWDDDTGNIICSTVSPSPDIAGWQFLTPPAGQRWPDRRFTRRQSESYHGVPDAYRCGHILYIDSNWPTPCNRGRSAPVIEEYGSWF